MRGSSAACLVLAFAPACNGLMPSYCDLPQHDGISCPAEQCEGTPGEVEVCDGKDNDCDGRIDEDVTTTWYRDADQDGYGDDSVSRQACKQPSGYVTDSTDCDDKNPLIHPDATEVCNGVDDTCNYLIDEELPTQTFYRDEDGDGYGGPGSAVQACMAPDGYVSNNVDCNDANGAINPGETEICDELDNDCNGQADENLSTFGPDLDGDGWTNDEGNKTCNKPHDFQGSGDCNDSDGTIHPGAAELCNGLDDNCNGVVDEGCP